MSYAQLFTNSSFIKQYFKFEEKSKEEILPFLEKSKDVQLYKESPIIKEIFKFNDKVIEKIISDLEKNKTIWERIILAIINKIKKKPIPQNVIQLFYEEPEKFFNQYNDLLEKTSFFDDAGISIFVHYFYVLYENYKFQNDSKYSKPDLKYEIYESNFDSFFLKESKYLLIQDIHLDTPLHKLARFKNKKFFFKIYEKLKKLNIINDELLSIPNQNDDTCYLYIVYEIENKMEIILKNNDFDLYYNFINDYPSIYKSLPRNDKRDLKIFSLKLKIYYKQLEGKDFNEAYDGVNNLLQNVNNDKDNISIFEYLYYPLDSGINYINYFFNICKSNEDYNKLFKLVFQLTNAKKTENDRQLGELCILEHMSYVLRKMNFYKSKGEYEINYGIKLINEILPIIIKDKSDNEIKIILSNKVKIIPNKNPFNKEGVVNNLIYNQNINFEKKYQILEILNKKINTNILENEIDEDFLDIYRFFKFTEKNKITEGNVSKIFKENNFLKKIFEDFIFIDKLYKLINELCNKYDKLNVNKYISNLSQFINNNYLKIGQNYKIRYALPDNGIKKIIDFLIL